jgi:hypothetical protein
MKVLSQKQQTQLDTLTDTKINEAVYGSDYDTFEEEEVLVNNARHEAEDEFLTLHPELI